MYVFISTSFVPIAYTVSSCTEFKALQVFFNFCRLSQRPRWTVIGNFSHAIRLQDTVVNASACIRAVCVCELCRCVCAVLGYSVCQGICSLLRMCLLENEG